MFEFNTQKDRCIDVERNAELRYIRAWPESLVEFSLIWNNKEIPFRAIRSVAAGEIIIYNVSFVGKNLLGVESKNYNTLSDDQKLECDNLIVDALRSYKYSGGRGDNEVIVNIQK